MKERMRARSEPLGSIAIDSAQLLLVDPCHLE